MPLTAEQACRIAIASDGLTATLTVDPDLDPAPIEPLFIDALIAAMGIRRDALLPDIVPQCAARIASERGQRLEIVVARGTPPVPSADGRLDLEPDLLRPVGVETPAPGAAIDHHTRSHLHVVRSGRKLATIVAPTIGADGLDVRGKVIPSRKPRAASFRIDETVVAREGALFAAVDGAFSFEEGRVRVTPTLEIPGSVDFSVGNIDFPGSVRVLKGVRDGFTVRCGRDLLVRDLVEAATLEVGESATLELGMAAREKGTLSAGLDLRAKYLSNTRARVGRHLFVSGELTNCTLIVNASCQSPTLTFAGGSMTVAGPCEVGHVGSESLVTTSLSVGRIPDLETELLELAQILPEVDQAIERAAAKLAMLRAATNKLTPAQAEELTELEFTHDGWTKRRADVLRAVADALALYGTTAHCELTVHGIIYPGATITLGAHVLTPRMSVKGPIRLSTDPQGHPVATDLTSNASSPADRFFKIEPCPIGQRLRALSARLHPDELAEAA